MTPLDLVLPHFNIPHEQQKPHQAFRTGDAEMVKMVLNHKSAEEDMLLSQSSVSKSKKEGKKPAAEGNPSAGPDDSAGDSTSGDKGSAGDAHEGGEEDDGGPSVTHELGFSAGAVGDESEGKSFRIRELPIRNPDECFGDDAREDATGLNLWAAAVVLARWLASPDMRARLDGKTILELGAGCGAG